jgi:hypothetical protein
MNACPFNLVTWPGFNGTGVSRPEHNGRDVNKGERMTFRSKYLMSGVLMLLLVSLTLIGSVSAETKINSLPYTITSPGNYVPPGTTKD